MQVAGAMWEADPVNEGTITQEYRGEHILFSNARALFPLMRFEWIAEQRSGTTRAHFARHPPASMAGFSDFR